MEFIQLSFFNNARLIIVVEETAVATTTAGKRMISQLAADAKVYYESYLERP